MRGNNLVTRKRRQPAINIVPLVDVLTVLVFFFMVTMQFKTMSSLNITAPEIKTAGKNEISEQIIIAVNREGEVYLNDRTVTQEQFEQAMVLAGQSRADTPILLIADEEAPLKHVTEIMDVCRSNKLNKIRLQSR
ncbi:ExbD/TolR family protein [Coraliomargarita akajimensis]|uniref:Biopolymer transport protein ExbD/TolR n=1 Tax=Coraliomargarita akajimensis (strain DSM 45221 / IAM 15411 / JCM 23193 / KCTC 12865 / 04OKA010-24) TaxID=583355 RepID=D5EIY0_CORAD|nr:biopolymer transporter ExbD [Coraliomargarita akajimensis]ADE54379.1 Biopolymer transport protein ExbD/TolR [Coraliomargarita akajimensis DSM 45221]